MNFQSGSTQTKNPVSPPEGPEAAPFFRDVAARFRKAETLLTEPAQKKRAAKRAEESEAIAASAASAHG